MVLIGKRMKFGKEQNSLQPEESGRVSASSSSTRFTKKSECDSSRNR